VCGRQPRHRLRLRTSRVRSCYLFVRLPLCIFTSLSLCFSRCLSSWLFIYIFICPICVAANLDTAFACGHRTCGQYSLSVYMSIYLLACPSAPRSKLLSVIFCLCGRQPRHRRPVVCFPSSAFCCLLSGVCCLLSAVCFLLSTFCFLLSAFCCLFSASSCLLSAICCEIRPLPRCPWVTCAPAISDCACVV
jgi:hypothetical protein